MMNEKIATLKTDLTERASQLDEVVNRILEFDNMSEVEFYGTQGYEEEYNNLIEERKFLEGLFSDDLVDLYEIHEAFTTLAKFDESLETQRDEVATLVELCKEYC